jgi:uncharacterized protein (DUF305 family)
MSSTTHDHARAGHDHSAHDHSGHDHSGHHGTGNVNSMAASATLHCLTGCAIGEIAGLVIGTAAGLANGWTIALSVSLAFLFGYLLSTLPLLKAGLALGSALSVVLAADTLSILTMEVVDNAVMATIPGAMDAGLVNVVFWIGMIIALTAAFVAAYPVNRYLLQRGKGHALTHEYHHADAEASGARRYIPTFGSGALAAVILAFMLGGLLVSAADEWSDGEPAGGHAMESRTAPNGDVYNDADVAFAQQMIPHHAQAIEMVDLTRGRDLSPEVEQLASQILEAQTPEIETMTGWLTDWDEEVPATSRDHANAHGEGDGEDMGGEMPGMMTDEEMAELESASDAEFEDLWLTMMVEHHEGAIEMARTEQEDGEFADAVAMAEDIEAGQTAEVDRMQGLLGS